MKDFSMKKYQFLIAILILFIAIGSFYACNPVDNANNEKQTVVDQHEQRATDEQQKSKDEASIEPEEKANKGKTSDVEKVNPAPAPEPVPANETDTDKKPVPQPENNANNNEPNITPAPANNTQEQTPVKAKGKRKG